MSVSTMRKAAPAAGAILALLALGCGASAQDAEIVNTGYFGDVAIRGYDPVAYFTESRAVQGSDEFSYEWLGATWHFASAEHRDAFAKEPEKYAPQYGGYCAYGVSQGYAVKIEPDVWSVVDGKLYLNYDKSVQKTWEKDIPGYIAEADKKWPGVLK